MSGNARPASADFATKNQVDTHDKPRLQNDAEPDANPQGREPRRWIKEQEWTNFIKEDPRFLRRPSSVVSIFRVPKFLKDKKKEAYVPQRVSLGPHHHGSAELPPMGYHKGRALRRMMARFNTNGNLTHVPNNEDFAHRAKEEIRKLDKKIRDSYGESIDCDKETLALMLSLDGCFILEVLRTLGGDGLPPAEATKCYDPIFGENKLAYAAAHIMKDILMLENQIPLFVLLKLLELELNSAVGVENKLLNLLMEGTLYFFSHFRDQKIDIAQWSWSKDSKPVHLLGFLHTVIESPTSMFQDENKARNDVESISIECSTRQCIIRLQEKDDAQYGISIPRAVELRNAGIKFKQCDGGIKEIKFDPNSTTIFLPRIFIQDGTEVLLRNLMAFEMCKPFKISYVTCYVSLLHGLIDSQEDVALLRRMGVLTNWLGSDQEVADLFNGLGKEVTVSMEDAFDELRKEVNAHYKNKIKVQIAQLVQYHFSSPWKALAFAAAIVMVLLNLVQTIFSIIHK